MTVPQRPNKKIQRIRVFGFCIHRTKHVFTGKPSRTFFKFEWFLNGCISPAYHLLCHCPYYASQWFVIQVVQVAQTSSSILTEHEASLPRVHCAPGHSLERICWPRCSFCRKGYSKVQELAVFCRSWTMVKKRFAHSLSSGSRTCPNTRD